MSPSDGFFGQEPSWSSASEANLEVFDSGELSPPSLNSPQPVYPNSYAQFQHQQAQSALYHANYNPYVNEMSYQPQYANQQLPPLRHSYPAFSTFPQNTLLDYETLEQLKMKHYKRPPKSSSQPDKRPSKRRRVQPELVNGKNHKDTVTQLTLIHFEEVRLFHVLFAIMPFSLLS